MKFLMALLTGISFWGLRGLVRDWLDIPGGEYSSPLVTACLAMLLLMLAGMAGALPWMWWALIVAGLAGFIVSYIVRRKPFSLGALALLALIGAYAFWHYHKRYFEGNDSVSHWALVAKYLLRTDRFPDGGTDLIYYPSYPVGSAAFIYYLCRGVGMGPLYYLSSQLFLCGFSLMPLFGFARENKPLGLIAALASAILLIGLNFKNYSIQVDALMAYMGIGGTCMIVQCAKHPRKAPWAVMPVALALVYVKAAGIFYSILLAALLAAIPEGDAGEKRVPRRLLVYALMIGAAFALWQLHVKLAYSGVGEGNHSVSLNSYGSNLKDKPRELVLVVASGLLRRMVSVDVRLTWAALCLVGVALMLAVRRDTGRWMKRLGGVALYSLGTFLVWYLMLFFMYLFSMTIDEAERLASIDRYEMTGIIYMVGAMCIFLVAFVSEEDWGLSLPGRVAGVFGILAALIGLMFVPSFETTVGENLFDRSMDGAESYKYILNLLDRNEVEEGKRYLVCTNYRKYPNRRYAVTKYELFSNDLMFIFFNYPNGNGEGPSYGYWKDKDMNGLDEGRVADIVQTFEENIDRFDYLLVYNRNEAFEEALDEVLERYTGDTKVCYAYSRK